MQPLQQGQPDVRCVVEGCLRPVTIDPTLCDQCIGMGYDANTCLFCDDGSWGRHGSHHSCGRDSSICHGECIDDSDYYD
jgi:hypothetical protein